MNFTAPQSTDILLSEAENENLYLKLIEQINKDFNLANEGIDFPMSTKPAELKVQLHEKIYRLIQYKFAEYLNLLYIIGLVPGENKRSTSIFACLSLLFIVIRIGIFKSETNPNVGIEQQTN